jgi:hypothetical protein
MSISTDIRSKGRIVRTHNGLAVYQPANTSYEHHVTAPATLPTDRPMRASIRVQARKVYGVPSGGNFVQPIFGSPRIIQGRVASIDGNTLTVQAGATFVCVLPTGKDTIDLHHGAIEVGKMVNVVAFPGATLEA